MDSYFEEAMFEFRDWSYDRIAIAKRIDMDQPPIDTLSKGRWEARVRSKRMRNLATNYKDYGDDICVMHTISVYITATRPDISLATVNIAFNPENYKTYFKAMGLLEEGPSTNTSGEFINFDRCTIAIPLDELRGFHFLPKRTKERIQAGWKRNIGEIPDLWEFLHKYFLLSRNKPIYAFKFYYP